MKKKSILVLTVTIIVLLCVAMYVMYIERSIEKNVVEITTGNEAVVLLQKTYPKYQEYPSNNLPPKDIEVLDVPDGWRVGMYIEGSGVSGILRADCFLVTRSGVITKTGLFQGEGPAQSIDLTTCTPKE